MKQGLLGINLLFEDGENIFVEKSMFSNLYVANIDEEANEIPYEKLDFNKLYANFFSLKINQNANESSDMNILKTTYNKKNLIEVELQFKDKSVNFHLASDTDPFQKRSINNYNQSFFQEGDLCMLICPYNIKYLDHLFA